MYQGPETKSGMVSCSLLIDVNTIVAIESSLPVWRCYRDA